MRAIDFRNSESSSTTKAVKPWSDTFTKAPTNANRVSAPVNTTGRNSYEGGEDIGAVQGLIHALPNQVNGSFIAERWQTTFWVASRRVAVGFRRPLTTRQGKRCAWCQRGAVPRAAGHRPSCGGKAPAG